VPINEYSCVDRHLVILPVNSTNTNLDQLLCSEFFVPTLGGVDHISQSFASCI
jgi:hypothetical protein